MASFASLVSVSSAPPAAAKGRILRWIALLPLAVALPAFAVSEPSLITGQKKSFGYSWQQELKLGAEGDKEITEEMGLYEHPGLQDYVNSIGQRVLQASNFASPNAPEIYRNTKFTFRVVDSSVVNAFALPGGFIYVTRGLLAHVQNEAQLAVVLGHEIAHVAARHSSQQARRSQYGQIGMIAAAVLGSKVLGDRAPDLAPGLIKGLGTGMQAFMLRYSREAEHESDNLGVSYAARAGYNAGDSTRFFQSLQRISAADGKVLPNWQSSHPDPGDRAKRVVELSRANPPGGGAAPVLNEEQFLERVEGIVVGDDPREGFVTNGVFYHPTLRFQFPIAAGWKVENQRAAVVMAEPNNRAMLGMRLAPGTNARDAAMKFAQGAKVEVITSGDTQINGLPTSVIIGKGTTEEGEVGVWNAFIEYDNKVFSILGYAPAASFEQQRPTFERVAAGFGPLQQDYAMNVQPARLKIVRADRNAPFASFVPTSLPQSITAESIAIMNQVNLNDAVPAGRLMKVPDVQVNQNPPSRATSDNDPYRRTPDYRRGQSSQGTYPNSPNGNSNSNYPPQNYPAQTYPNDGRYPPQANPNQSYPNQGYPNQGYPQQPASNYPSDRYPSNQPQSNYPNQGGYPQSSYPQSSYPQSSYPQSNYPAQGGAYPSQPQNSYPNGNTGYPAQGQPGQSYPQGSGYPQSSGYPQTNYPQFPQPPANGQPAQPQQPQRRTR